MSGVPQASLRSVGGLPNLTFDLITVLQNKLQAIAALDTYKEDARKANHPHALKVFTEIQEADLLAVHRLRAMVSHELVVGLEDQHGFTGRSGAVDNEPPTSSDSRPGDDDAMVEEASEESFPASDPPAYNRGQQRSVT